MRTTIALQEDVLLAAKELARQRGVLKRIPTGTVGGGAQALEVIPT